MSNEIKNLSLAVFVLNPRVRAMKCSYDPENKADKPEIFKTFNPDMKTGDYVVVPTDTRLKRTVCKIVEADCEYDIESMAKCEFIVCKVDHSDYDVAVAAENEMIATIKKNNEIEKRKALAESLFKNQSELASLGLVKLGGPAAIEPPPSPAPAYRTKAYDAENQPF